MDEKVRKQVEEFKRTRGRVSHWNPQEGDLLVGAFIGQDVNTGKFGGYPTYDFEVGDSITRVHAKHAVLADELEDLDLNIGDRVAIVYEGRPEGKKYYSYTVMPLPLEED